MTATINLNEQLKHHFGFDSFKGDQEAIIRNLLEGNDTFVLMPTGGGKSLCYQLPSLIMEGTAIVVSPLIALMKNQVDVVNGLSEESGVAHYLNSSLNRAAINQVYKDVHEGRTKLLYVAPESLNKEDNLEFFRSFKISFYAIDEAHCISEWGHDFRPEYRNIRPTINKIGAAPVIALTATATDKVRMDIKKSLGITDAKEFKSSFNRANLYYEVRQKTNDIDKQIIKFIKQERYHLLHIAQEGGGTGCRAESQRHKSRCLSRRTRLGNTLADARRLPHGAHRRNRGYHSLRHGHRQTRCALRDTLRHTEES